MVRGFPFGSPIHIGGYISSKESLASVVREKLEEMGYFPTYITPNIKQRIQDLQEEELDLRKRKAFTLEKGVEMLEAIDEIHKDLKKAKDEAAEIATAAARKRKSNKPKPKRKIVKKSRK